MLSFSFPKAKIGQLPLSPRLGVYDAIGISAFGPLVVVRCAISTMKTIICICFVIFVGILGTAGIKPEGRIIGGVTALPTQFPWVVEIRAITSRFDLTGTKWCAGSILNVHWVVTTAHCAKLLVTRFKIVGGNIDLFRPDLLTIQPRSVIFKKIHPGYNKATRENDIALLRVIPAWVFDNTTVGSIPYAHFNYQYQGAATTAGWGSREDKDFTGPRYLQTGLVTLISNATCKVLRPDVTIYSSQVCATGDSSAPCFGDAGGPVMCNRTGILVLCGIISETTGCTRNSPPKLVTLTPWFYDWIQVGITF